MMHADQIEVTAPLVRRMIRAQFPQWSALPIRPVEAVGTVNAIFRLGDAMAARLPLRPDDADRARQRLQHEARAMDDLAAHARVPVPRPVAIGASCADYPLPWSIQTWLPGRTANEIDPGGSFAFADDLAQFITDLRSAETGGQVFTGRGRGGALPVHDPWIEHCLERSESLFDVPALRSLWRRLRTLPDAPTCCMTHGDLIPGNVLVHDGRLTGVLDTGGFAATDPALDLVAAWHLLDPGPRERLRGALGCTDVEWMRGMAWALQQALGAAWYYADTNPDMSRMGRTTIARILNET